MPAALPTEALALAWAVQVGAVTWEEVVAWADGWILRSDAPPAELLELSLAGRRPDEAFTLLRRIAQVGDPGAALPLLAQKLRSGLLTGHLDSLVLAAGLKDMGFLSLNEEPDDVRLPSPPPEFCNAAWELSSIADQRSLWIKEGADAGEYDRSLAGEVLGVLERFS